jgi:hypothetical protein
MYPPELASKIALWRQRAQEGTMSPDDYREALSALRAGRLAAALTTKPKKPKKEKAEKPDTTLDLFNELDNL